MYVEKKRYPRKELVSFQFKLHKVVINIIIKDASFDLFIIYNLLIVVGFDDAPELFLALHSGVTTRCTERPIWDAKD